LFKDPARARALAAHGRRTILARHTCAHRVDELLGVAEEIGVRHLGPSTARRETRVS
jgi:spore maturation protein CgeB